MALSLPHEGHLVKYVLKNLYKVPHSRQEGFRYIAESQVSVVNNTAAETSSTATAAPVSAIIHFKGEIFKKDFRKKNTGFWAPTE